mgnify:CR=1 FL=1
MNKRHKGYLNNAVKRLRIMADEQEVKKDQETLEFIANVCGELFAHIDVNTLHGKRVEHLIKHYHGLYWKGK